MFSDSAKVVKDSVRPKDPPEEGFTPNISQSDELLSSSLTTRKQELVEKTTAETTHFKVAEEQDRLCSGTESEEASHCEGQR